MKHIINHTIQDTILLLPFLFLSYVLIEIVEYFLMKKLRKSKILSSKLSPLIGAGVGLIPQCGFSVVATDLYSENKISMGTIIAIFIATSDESIPQILASGNKIISIVPLLPTKFIIAIIIGYFTDFILKMVKNKTQTNMQLNNTNFNEIHTGCCGHEIDNPEKENKLKSFIYHPLIHALKIFLFILIFNFIFKKIIQYIVV